MGTKYLSLAAAVCCVIASSPLFGYVPDSVFEAYKPQVLVTPDNLPVLSWKDPGVDRDIDPSELNSLNVCIPGACSQAALDAGAAYYQILAGLVAYYDQYGRLVGTSEQPTIAAASAPYSTQAAAANTDPRFTDAGVTALSNLVGATPGAFEVLPSGAATYRIPIDIPPGTAGAQPKLALSYNSQGGNGLLAVGWSLEGLSAITRCPQTYAQDGRRTGITFTSTDRLCLDGQRLINDVGAYWADNSEYRTEIDSFSKIVADVPAGADVPSSFQVETKSGEVLQYEAVRGNQRQDGTVVQVIVAWPLTRVTDAANNYFELAYDRNVPAGEYYPTRIDYTGHAADVAPYASVNFEYGEPERPDPTEIHRAGVTMSTTKRLESIVTKVGVRIVREYNLLYDATTINNPLSRVAHIQQCANAAPETSPATYTARCLPATSFTWQGYPVGFEEVKHTGRSADRVHESTHTMDVDGDGLDDLVYGNDGTWRILFANGNGFEPEKNTTIPASSAETAVFDYDGDGRQDYLSPAAYAQQYYRTQPSA